MTKILLLALVAVISSVNGVKFPKSLNVADNDWNVLYEPYLKSEPSIKYRAADVTFSNGQGKRVFVAPGLDIQKPAASFLQGRTTAEGGDKIAKFLRENKQMEIGKYTFPNAERMLFKTPKEATEVSKSQTKVGSNTEAAKWVAFLKENQVKAEYDGNLVQFMDTEAKNRYTQARANFGGDPQEYVNQLKQQNIIAGTDGKILLFLNPEDIQAAQQALG